MLISQISVVGSPAPSPVLSYLIRKPVHRVGGGGKMMRFGECINSASISMLIDEVI